MYIKSIKLSGFKSFVDRTTVSLERGVTAIVGPNGCGKSNICDSLRWVFGEQSSKLLRGGKMEELIFNGSETRKSVGMAEVQVTLCGLNGAIKRPELSNFDEISVTRRLFRSGESAYLINKTNCRLKDIIEIFLDTGISTRSFSIMEQAQVNRLIVSRPFERRYIIEEAAGVIKYKHRRLEAINKIDASRQNLLRIQDITRELGTRMNSLKREAGKARRYKTYKDELSEVGVSLLSFENELLKSLFMKTDLEFQVLKKRGEEAETLITERQEVVNTLRRGIEEGSKCFEEKRRLHFEASSGIKQAGERVKLMEEQKSNLTSEIQRKREEIADLGRDFLSLSEKFDLCDADSLSINDELTEKDFLFSHEGETLLTLDQGVADIEKDITGGERELLGLVDRITKKRNRLIEVETRMGGVAGRVERLSGEIDETVTDIQEARESLEAESSSASELNDLLKSRREEGVAAKNSLNETLKRMAELNSAASALRETLSRKRGLLESRLELKKKFEGFGSGVKAVMAHNRAGRLTGIHTLLVDIIRTSPDYETAMEAALGERLSGVIVKDLRSGMTAAEMLSETREGRGAFIPLSAESPSATQLKGEGGEGLVGRASDLLDNIDPEHREIIDTLLGNVLIFNTTENALLFYNGHLGEGWCIVTLDGTAVSREGVVTGGKEGKDSLNLLSKNREILELQREVEKIEGEMISLEESLRALAVTEKEHRECEKRVAFEVHEFKVEAENSERELERLSFEEGRLERKLETLNLEREQVSEEREVLERESLDAKEFLEAREDELRGVEARLAGKKEEMGISRKELESLKERMNASKVEVASLRTRLEYLSSEKSRISGDMENRRVRVSRLAGEIKESESKLEELKRLAVTREAETLSLSKVADSLNTETANLSSDLAARGKTLESCEEELRGVVKELALIREDLGKVSLKKSEAGIRVEHLQSRGREEFSVDTDDLPASAGGFDEPAARERLKFLKREIERYGDVNLTAISECEKVEERFSFLKTQEEDLVQSVLSLDETIKKIDQTTRKLFSETFETINENFKKIFRRLFGGGKAELVLVDSGDGKEPGIDILVQPPGKKLRNIQLMSAGEKAMTSISILFSVFMVRPSPFCLLDEIDAPLDDSNIGRFKEMVRELGSETQFVIITHNQRTMTFADRLYGVTMEEHGVSKVLSVDIKEGRTQRGDSVVDTDAGKAGLLEDAVCV